MEISKPKRLPLPVRQIPSRYNELRKALNILDIGEMVEVKIKKPKVNSLRSYIFSIRADKKFAIRTLTNDGETVEMGIWRIK